MPHLIASPVVWGTLPRLPDRHGLAGAFAGVSADTLLVAGGANFPDAPLAEGGKKVWHDTVYVVGGTSGPADTTASRRFYSLDLEHLSAGWKSLPPLPGQGRILPVAAARDGAFFVVSGASLVADASGKPARIYLKDGWRFQPGRGWSAMADAPHAAVAAPTSAPLEGERQFLIGGGDDGTLAPVRPGTPHPGFLHSVMAYDVLTNEWSDFMEIPDEVSPPVTTSTTLLGAQTIIPSGEVKPGIRSPQVVFLKP